MDKIALIIGHNERSKGAYSTPLGITEYEYYKQVANKVKELLPNNIDVYYRHPNRTYGAEMRVLLNELNKHDYKFCLELHFNSNSNPQANGSMCLVYHTNEYSKQLALKYLELNEQKFNTKIRTVYQKVNGKNVGIKGYLLVSSDNTQGGYGICHSKDTYILLEPFFGSNKDEALKYLDPNKSVELLIDFIKGELQ